MSNGRKTPMLKRLVIGFAGASAIAGTGLAAFSWNIARKIEAALPPSGRFLPVDGARMHYTDIGSGPAIVLIHGLGGQLLNFPASGLAQLQGDYRVIAIDRPGSGYSTRPLTASATLRSQAATLAKVIRGLGLQKPLVVGHSLGGAVALTLALEHPDCVGGLALISPLTQLEQSVPKAFSGLAVRSRMLRFLIGWTIAIPLSMRGSRDTLNFVFGPDPVPANFATEGGGMLGLRPKSYYAASSDLAAVNDDLPGVIARYAELKIPAGILHGTADRVLNHAAHGKVMVGKVPGLELELVEGGGHMTPITAPDRTIAFIGRMAQRVAAQQRG